MEHKAPFITSSSSSPPSTSPAAAAPHLEDQQPQKVPRRRHILSRKRYILLAVLVTLIIVALAVGLGVGLTRKHNNNSNQDAGSSQQDLSKPSISNSSVPRDPSFRTMGVTPSTNGVWQPPVNASWQIVLSSPLQLDLNSQTITPNVDVWDIDMFTNSKETIDHLHSLGKRVVCYFSAGSYEPNRPDSDRFQAGDKGGELNGWPGEYWLKLSSPNVRSIMADRIVTAHEKGCDAIDPDNVDGYSNTENGHGLTEQDSVDFINFLSENAAKYNMAVGLKNAGAIIPSVLDKVHFAVNEQCVEYSECTVYSKFIENSKPVFHIEYPKGDSENTDSAVASTDSNTVCNQQGKAAGTYDFSTTIKNMNLDGWVQYCDGALAVTPCGSNGGASSYSGGTGSSTGDATPESPASYPETPSSYPETEASPAAPSSAPIPAAPTAASSVAAIPAAPPAAPSAAAPASYPETDDEADPPVKPASSSIKAAAGSAPTVPTRPSWKHPHQPYYKGSWSKQDKEDKEDEEDDSSSHDDEEEENADDDEEEDTSSYDDEEEDDGADDEEEAEESSYNDGEDGDDEDADYEDDSE